MELVILRVNRRRVESRGCRRRDITYFLRDVHNDQTAGH